MKLSVEENRTDEAGNEMTLPWNADRRFLSPVDLLNVCKFLPKEIQ